MLANGVVEVCKREHGGVLFVFADFRLTRRTVL